MAERMQQQAERFGAEVVLDLVTSVDFSKGSPFQVRTYGEEYLADAVVVTIGANPANQVLANGSTLGAA
jgi:thioredoxin reductase